MTPSDQPTLARFEVTFIGVNAADCERKALEALYGTGATWKLTAVKELRVESA